MTKKVTDENDQPQYSRSAAARKCGYSPARLIQFEREGLISPTRIVGGFVLYRESDVALLAKKKQAWTKKRPFSIDG